MTNIEGNEADSRLIATRRTALKQGAVGAAGIFGGSSLLAACGSDGDTASTSSSAGPPTNVSGTINALCWEGYTDPAWTKSFTKETGVKVKSTFIGSNDELVAKLRGAPDQYDLVSPSSDTTNILIDAGQVRTIDLNQVPNAKTTMKFFQTAPAVNVDGKL
jgi:spermidine/putrescine-binding protein